MAVGTGSCRQDWHARRCKCAHTQTCERPRAWDCTDHRGNDLRQLGHDSMWGRCLLSHSTAPALPSTRLGRDKDVRHEPQRTMSCWRAGARHMTLPAMTSLNLSSAALAPAPRARAPAAAPDATDAVALGGATEVAVTEADEECEPLTCAWPCGVTAMPTVM